MQNYFHILYNGKKKLQIFCFADLVKRINIFYIIKIIVRLLLTISFSIKGINRNIHTYI